MVQIDLHKIKEWVKIHFISIIIIIILLFLLFNRNGNIDTILSENKILKKEIGVIKKDVQNKLIQNKKLEIIISKYEKQVTSLDNENSLKDNELKKLSESNKKIIEDIKKMSEDDLTKFFKNRYGPKNAIVKTNLGIAFKDTISKKIAVDLTNCDYTEEKLNIVEYQYNNQIKITSLKDSIIEVNKEEKENMNFMLNGKDNIITNQESLINNQEKVITKQKRKSSLLKLSVISGVLLGFGTGFLITK